MLNLALGYSFNIAVIDFNTFDIKKDWFKLIVIGLPALGGYMSSINTKKKDQNNG